MEASSLHSVMKTDESPQGQYRANASKSTPIVAGALILTSE
jgi:hypothetical protein